MNNLSLIFALLFFTASASAQTVGAAPAGQRPAPERSIAGVKLNDEVSGRAFLAGYSFRRDEANRPVYYFYDEYGTQVLALTAQSPERRFLIARAEVFRVGRDYMKTYYVLKDTSFTSESGFFLGNRSSAASLIFGVPNRTSVKKLIEKKGTPDARTKNGKIETLIYNFAASPAGDVAAGAYRAEYVFVGGKLDRFKIETALSAPNRKL